MNNSERPTAVPPPPPPPPPSDPHNRTPYHDHPYTPTHPASPLQAAAEHDSDPVSYNADTQASRGLLSNFINSTPLRHKKELSRPVKYGIALVALVILILLGIKVFSRSAPPPSNRPNPALHIRELPCTTWPVKKENNSYVPESYVDVLGFHFGGHPDANDSYGAFESEFTKPTDFRIVAVVFYGRREYVDILDCYLRRNLVSNGGILDEVQFLVNTENREDIAFLDRLVGEEKLYSKQSVNTTCRGKPRDFSCLWSDMTAEATLYIKIDDDMLYLHENAIPQLVQARLDNPDAIAVGSALINSHLLSWPVYHNGGIYAYLPEPTNYTFPPPLNPISWAASELPRYPDSLIHKFDGYRNGKETTKFSPKVPDPPFQGHRWLPLSNQSLILETPIYEIDHSNLDIAQSSWMVAAQQHYSFFQNLEEGTLKRYDVGNDRGIWDTQYRRYNLNFAAIWGSDIKKHSPVPKDDEGYFTVRLPQKINRPFLVTTRSLVSHFHFNPQAKGVRSTDLLDRYRAYADEKICSDNTKMPMAGKCERSFSHNPALPIRPPLRSRSASPSDQDESPSYGDA